MRPSEAHQLAYELLAEHDLPDWFVSFDRSHSYAGITDYKYKRITLSIPYIEAFKREDIEQVVLHEIAHARVGPGHGHGQVWYAEAQRIGFKGGATSAPLPLRDPAWKIVGGWAAITCGLFVSSIILGTLSLIGLIGYVVYSAWSWVGPVPKEFQ